MGASNTKIINAEMLKNELSVALREASEGRWITTKSGAHILIQNKDFRNIRYPSALKTSEDKAHYDEVLNSIKDADINTFVTSQLMVYKDTHMLPETLYFQKMLSNIIGVESDDIGTLEKYLPTIEREEFRSQIKTARDDLISNFNDNLGKNYEAKIEKYFVDKEGRFTIGIDNEIHANNLENILEQKIEQKIKKNQKLIREEYGNEITLYRGITDQIPIKGGEKIIGKIIKDIEKGSFKPKNENIRSIGKPLTSFTEDVNVAAYFSGTEHSVLHKAVIFEVKVPIKYIVSNYKTESAFKGRDYMSNKVEKEFLVAIPKDIKIKAKVYDWTSGKLK